MCCVAETEVRILNSSPRSNPVLLYNLLLQKEMYVSSKFASPSLFQLSVLEIKTYNIQHLN